MLLSNNNKYTVLDPKMQIEYIFFISADKNDFIQLTNQRVSELVMPHAVAKQCRVTNEALPIPHIASISTPLFGL